MPTQTSSSASIWSMAASMPLATSEFTALRASGRLIVMIPMLPCFSYSIVVMPGTIEPLDRPVYFPETLRSPTVARPSAVVFDLDGTLIDSDEALVVPFVALGVPREEISFGHPIEVECARLGLTVADYIAAYDPGVTVPFDGVEDLLSELPSWSVCSNK